MQKYQKLELNQENYNLLMNVQFNNKSIVREHMIGSRVKMFSQNTLIATLSNNNSLDIGNIKQGQFNAFLGSFNKQLYKQFLLNDSLHSLHIDFNGSSRAKNYDNWEKLQEGDFFYNIDLNSAYWQIANKLGYVNDKLFSAYIDLDDYKQVKRYCISFLARQNKMIYHVEDEKYEISCDTTVLRKVYENIRCYLYQVVNKGVESISEWLEYNIDGITVLNVDVDKVKSYFEKENLKFKITECRKLNDKEYLYGAKVRRFKNK